MKVYLFLLLATSLGSGAAVTTCADAEATVPQCCTNANSGRDQELCYSSELIYNKNACLGAKGPCQWKCSAGPVIRRGDCPA